METWNIGIMEEVEQQIVERKSEFSIHHPNPGPFIPIIQAADSADTRHSTLITRHSLALTPET